MANKEIQERILRALENGPLYITQIAKNTSLSKNTVGKYVEILTESGKVGIVEFANTKMVHLNKR